MGLIKFYDPYNQFKFLHQILITVSFIIYFTYLDK